MSFSIPSDDDLNRVTAYDGMINSPQVTEFPAGVNEQMQEMVGRIRSIDCFGPRQRDISQGQQSMQEFRDLISGLKKELESGEDELDAMIAANQKLQKHLKSLQSELIRRKLYNRSVQPIYQWGEQAATKISQ